MNWKAEGYKVGCQATMVVEHLYGESRVEDVIITHAGTKILKVDDNGRSIKFVGRGASCSVFGIYYKIYKNREEYDEYIRIQKEKTELVDKINNQLNKLKLEQLTKINSIIEGV